MMKEIGLGLVGLGLLYLTRQKLTVDLARLVGRFGGRQRAFVWLWSMIFLPGTIIHEMSHLFAAAITGTKIGKVEIFPELPRGGIGADDRLPHPRPEVGARNDKLSVHLGYIQTQELGLFRGFLVGTAPLLVGLGVLIWIADARSLDSLRSLGMTYLFFTVANSLFLSWTDVKQALPLLAIAAILGGGLYFWGVRPAIIPDSRLLTILNSLWKTLMISVGVNLAAIVIMAIGNGIIGKLREFRGNQS